MNKVWQNKIFYISEFRNVFWLHKKSDNSVIRFAKTKEQLIEELRR